MATLSLESDKGTVSHVKKKKKLMVKWFHFEILGLDYRLWRSDHYEKQSYLDVFVRCHTICADRGCSR